ncbi:MAG TPA: SCO family protein [Gammaproteobacteria bacterium]|nr:SCO family protein [Gammaproteobacteria bacterium]
MRVATITAAAVASLFLLAGCGPSTQQWSTQSIRGAMPDLAFRLTDDRGRPVTGAQFHGDVTLLFFGYTHCPDVCPATLAILDAARQKLGEEGKRVKILFVSVDPKRDGPKELADYTQAFGDGVVGLTGTQAELQALTKRYRVAFRYGDPDKNGNYLVYHSAAIFAFDPQGHAQLLMSYTNGLPAIEHDLQQLVAANS